MSDKGGVMSNRSGVMRGETKGRDEPREGSWFTWAGWAIIEGRWVITLITHNEK